MHDPAALISADDLSRTLDLVLETGRRADTLPDELVDDEVREIAAAFRRAVDVGLEDVAARVVRLRANAPT